MQSLVRHAGVHLYLHFSHFTFVLILPHHLYFAGPRPFAGHGTLAVTRITTAGATFLRWFFPWTGHPGDADRFAFNAVKMFLSRLFFNSKIAFRAAIGSPTRAVTECFERKSTPNCTSATDTSPMKRHTSPSLLQEITNVRLASHIFIRSRKSSR